MKLCRRCLSSAKFKVVAGGEELVKGRIFSPQAVPAPHIIEERLERIHQNTNNSNIHDWPAEIRGLYRDILKGYPYMQRYYRIGIPESVLRKNIRKLFEEGPKLMDPAAMRLKVIKASQEVEEFFQIYMQDSHMFRYANIDSNETLQKDIQRSSAPTQAAFRFFNEGKNVLTEHGMGTDDVTENRLFMTREEAYRKRLAAMSTKEFLSHYLPALDGANAATLDSIKTTEDVDGVVHAAIRAAEQKPVNTAEDFLSRYSAFCKLANLPHNSPIGESLKRAWETYRNLAFNAAVITHSIYKLLVKDPSRNFLLKGPAENVRLGTSIENKLPKVVEHLYYSDQLPETWSQDLNISYLADLKGIDRRMDLLLEEEIAFRSEQLIRIYVHTVECIKATYPYAAQLQELRSALQKGETPSVDSLPFAAEIKGVLATSDLFAKLAAFDDCYAALLTKHLNESDASSLKISSYLGKLTCDPALDILQYKQ